MISAKIRKNIKFFFFFSIKFSIFTAEINICIFHGQVFFCNALMLAGSRPRWERATHRVIFLYCPVLSFPIQVCFKSWQYISMYLAIVTGLIKGH